MFAAAETTAVELRPLEEMRSLVEDLERMNDAIHSFLARFNGPWPGQLNEIDNGSDRPPAHYRYDIDRLRSAVTETGSLVNALAKIG